MPQVKGSGTGRLVTAPDGTKYIEDRGSGSLSGMLAGALTGAQMGTAGIAAAKTSSSSAKKSSGGNAAATAAATAAAKAAAQQQALNQLMGFLQQRLSEELSSAQSWYERQSGSVKSLYDNLAGGLAKNHELQLAELLRSYNTGVAATNKEADAKRGEAWVQKMMSERSLPQKMSAMGYAGGAAESTLLALANNYGQNVNKLETARTDALSGQLNSYNSSKASATQSYNSQLASNQTALAKQLMSLDSGYANMISKAQSTYASQRASALRKLI